ncbi:MAG: TetR/AcrR family transcriptional regulator [Nesterenkonia sp.]|nr:TetR/AcrR family transcriptional regulator [Nesterenkonia sp.]
MPRISRPTVAEHRAARERALLDAAHELLMETGEAPSLSHVARRAGMARTSIYQYYAVKQDLLRAMVRDIYPRWTRRISDAMGAAPTDADRVMAYAVANVELVADGAHAVGSALAALAPGEELDEQATSMHRDVQQPLVETLSRLQVESPDQVAELITSVVHGAAKMLETGHDRSEAIGHLKTVLGPLVRELGGDAPQ